MFDFIIDGKTFRISFSYPDKYAENLRKYTKANLLVKIVNPENTEDYIWELVDDSVATCNLSTDYFDKFIGKKVCFKKLLDKNFDRKTRTDLWEKFFNTF